MARQVSPALQRMRWFAVVLCMIAIALNYIDRSTLAVGNGRPATLRVLRLTELRRQLRELKLDW